MKHFKVGLNEYLVIGVPESLQDCTIELSNLPFGKEEVWFFRDDNHVHTINLDVEAMEYEIIGQVKDLTDEQTKDILGMNYAEHASPIWWLKCEEYNLSDTDLIIKKI